MIDSLVQGAAAAGEPYALRVAWVYADEAGGPALVRDTAVLVDQGRVVEVRPGPPPGSFPCLELPSHLLLPGLISAHTHVAAGTPTRGVIEGGRSFALPLQLVEALDDQALNALTAHNLAEIVRGGCTTTCSTPTASSSPTSPSPAASWCGTGS